MKVHIFELRIKIYMLFAGLEVRIGKNCARGLDYGPRPIPLIDNIYFPSVNNCPDPLTKRCYFTKLNESIVHIFELSEGFTELFLLIYLLTIYSIQYKYIKEIEITKQTKSCGEGDSQKRKSTILGMSPLIKI